MATAQTWVDSARRHLLSGRTAERNTLLSSYTAGSGTLSFTTGLGGIVAGSTVAVGLNVFYVVAVNSATNSATVIGGQDGSTDVNASAGTLVFVNPRFSTFAILDAINQELSDLSAPQNGLFAIGTVDLTATDLTVGYDLAGVTDLIDVYDVRMHSTASTAKDYGQTWKVDYRLDRYADLTVFPSGYSLQLLGGWGNLIGSSWGTTLLGIGTQMGVRVIYKKGFTQLVNLTDDVATTNLPSTAWDIPPIGAAMRLMMPREAIRNDLVAQGDSRRATEVPPGAVLNSARALSAWLQQRITAESGRLAAQFPSRRW